MGKITMISVIMPVFNCGKYIEQAIDSIMAQTFQDFELIIIDDGSTDDTWEMVTSHPQFGGSFFIKGIPHAGIAVALNKGLSMAKGKYVARHDGDDYSHPLRFERQIEYLEGHPGCKAVGTGMVLIDGNGVPFKNLGYPMFVSNTTLVRWWPCVAHPTVMMRSSVFDDIGLYDEDLDYCEDYDLWLRINEHYGDGSIHNLPDCLYTYRQHDLTRTSEGVNNGLLKLYDEMVLLKAKIRKAKNET